MAVQQYDISDAEKVLTDLGFGSFLRTNLLIAIKKNPPLLQALIEFYPIFYANKRDMSHHFLAKMVSEPKGLEIINAYKQYYMLLREMKFELTDLWLIKINYPEYQIFPLIIENRGFFEAEKIDVPYIVALCEATRNLEEFNYLKQVIKTLQRLKISKDKILFLKKHGLVERFLAFVETLPPYSSVDKILYYYIQQSSSIDQLLFLFDYDFYLQSLKLDKKFIDELSAKPNAKQLINLIQSYFPNLILRHFSPQRLYELLIGENGDQNLEALYRLAPVLLMNKYHKEVILTLVDDKNGALNLQKLYNKHAKYHKNGLDPASILKEVFAEIENEESQVDYQNKAAMGTSLSFF